MPPSRSLTSDATVLIPAAVLRSAGMKRAAAVFGPGPRAVATTVAPALDNRWTIAAPIPWVPPVTSAHLPTISRGSTP